MICSDCGLEAPDNPNNMHYNAGPLPLGWHDVFRILKFDRAEEIREPRPMCDECYKSKLWTA